MKHPKYLLNLLKYLMTLLLIVGLLGCNSNKVDESGNEVSKEELKSASKAEEEKRLEVKIDPKVLEKNERDLLSNPELKTLGSFSEKILRTTMRSLQHTYWVMAEANDMKKYLESAGVELVGDVIVPGDEKKS